MSLYSIKPGGEDTAAPRNLKKRMAIIAGHVDLPGKRVLDCGCGRGLFVLDFLRRGADAWGIEYEAVKVADYRQNNPELAQRVVQGDIQNIQEKDQQFDLILINEVLEHVPDDRLAIKEIHRVLKPHGQLFIFSPNRLYPFETHNVILKGSGKLLPLYFPFVPYVPLRLGSNFFTYRARNYWPGELRHMVAQLGFRINQSGFVWQTFENISGKQPYLLKNLRPLLRAFSNIAERLPVLQSFGVSQYILAEKS